MCNSREFLKWMKSGVLRSFVIDGLPSPDVSGATIKENEVGA